MTYFNPNYYNEDEITKEENKAFVRGYKACMEDLGAYFDSDEIAEPTEIKVIDTLVAGVAEYVYKHLYQYLDCNKTEIIVGIIDKESEERDEMSSMQ